MSVDDVADVTLVLLPRMDTHELGAYAAQLLIMFDCHEVALQVARDAFERLSQVRVGIFIFCIDASSMSSFGFC